MRLGRNPRPPSARLALVVAAVSLAGACSVDGLAFVEDDRIEIVSPKDDATVARPVVVEWTAPPELPGDGSFAVFLDRAPIGPGKRLMAMAENDDDCKRDPECPNDQWFRVRGVYTTDERSVELTELQPALDEDDEDELHEATVVILDADGRRVGEAAWWVEFKVREDR